MAYLYLSGNKKRACRSTRVSYSIQSIGARGFEPPASCAQGRRASQTALRPDIGTRLRYRKRRNVSRLELTVENDLERGAGPENQFFAARKQHSGDSDDASRC